ncbi:MAG: Coenzyme F420 hydrogenase/dehydrogenase, beta subunit C-terminal domain [Eubacterium sp.]|nr:Coenzyme F420 hydrogenase/dehydrogenase, beta subunit C-terminal domain [Eubacterium sp.]
MIKIRKKEDCCGCTACMSVCPRQCIAMNQDNEGFLYPQVDETKCVSCGLCEKICPVQNCTEKEYTYPEAFAAYAINPEIRMHGSSGGIFPVLAENIIEMNGVVYGAAFDREFRVCHTRVTTFEELKNLYGSKYVQSNLNGIFNLVKEDLNNGKKSLFSGTACQIAGLKCFLGREYKNLYTCDVLCHGVPSPVLWEKFLMEQKLSRNVDIKAVDFRDKSTGWINYSFTIEFSNGEKRTIVYRQDDYMKMFLGNLSLRPSCYTCKFKKINRCSDISIGDFWGIERVLPSIDDGKGISVILLHSAKGRELLKKCEKELRTFQVDVDAALPITSDARRSVNKPKKRRRFFYIMKKSSFSQLKKYTKPSFFERLKWKYKGFIGNI